MIAESPFSTSHSHLQALFRSPALNSDNFDQTILQAEGAQRAPDLRLKIVYFWGDNCPNCESAKRELSLMIDDLSPLAIDFHSVNAYEQMDLATRFGLYGIPAFLFFKKGQLIGRITSFPTRQSFLQAIHRAL